MCRPTHCWVNVFGLLQLHNMCMVQRTQQGDRRPILPQLTILLCSAAALPPPPSKSPDRRLLPPLAAAAAPASSPAGHGASAAATPSTPFLSSDSLSLPPPWLLPPGMAACRSMLPPLPPAVEGMVAATAMASSINTKPNTKGAPAKRQRVERTHLRAGPHQIRCGSQRRGRHRGPPLWILPASSPPHTTSWPPAWEVGQRGVGLCEE